MSMNSDYLLKLARSRIFSIGASDASAMISIMNASYGLGKIIYALEKIGLDSSSVYTVFAPDGGISRNHSRWDAGFSYGCVVNWANPKNSASATFPQIKPNACGVLACKLKSSANVPSIEDLQNRLYESQKTGVVIEKNDMKFNLGVSNHFIELCKVEKSNYDHLKKDDIVAFIHTSPSELKMDLYDYDLWKNKGGKWIDTPLGAIFTLVGDLADAYYKKYREIDLFGRIKREKIAEILFDDFEIICNPTHQGLSQVDTVRLGLYDSSDNTTSKDKPVFPLTLRWDLPIYLIEGLPNINEKNVVHINPNNGEKISNDMQDLFLKLNILPHGGGYSLPFSSQGWSIKNNGYGRSFVHKTGRRSYVFHKPSELPYYYRGKEVLDKVVKHEFGKVAASFKQIYTLKY